MATIAFAMKATSGLGGLFAGIALDLIDVSARRRRPARSPPRRCEALGLAVGPGLMRCSC